MLEHLQQFGIAQTAITRLVALEQRGFIGLHAHNAHMRIISQARRQVFLAHLYRQMGGIPHKILLGAQMRFGLFQYGVRYQAFVGAVFQAQALACVIVRQHRRTSCMLRHPSVFATGRQATHQGHSAALWHLQGKIWINLMPLEIAQARVFIGKGFWRLLTALFPRQFTQ